MLQVSPERYPTVRAVLHEVPFNTLFAHSVLDGLADGEVWADSVNAPTWVHIIHAYGMTLLWARPGVLDWATLTRHVGECRRRFDGLWMQVHPVSLAAQIDARFDAELAPNGNPQEGKRIARYARSNFAFDIRAWSRAAPTDTLPAGFALRLLTFGDFDPPDISVSPCRFWKGAETFIAHGGGWCVTADGALAALAFASYRQGNLLEIGVETYPAFRGQGLATRAARALVDQSLRAGLEPVWSCRTQNAASVALARAVGFTPTFEGPYYYLPKARA